MDPWWDLNKMLLSCIMGDLGSIAFGVRPLTLSSCSYLSLCISIAGIRAINVSESQVQMKLNHFVIYLNSLEDNPYNVEKVN